MTATLAYAINLVGFIAGALGMFALSLLCWLLWCMFLNSLVIG